MANGVFNVSLGRVNDRVDRVFANSPANSALVISLWQDTIEADSALRDRATLAAVVAANDECDATGYARVILDDSDLLAGSVVDNVNDRRDSDIVDPTFPDLGGAVNNELSKLTVSYDPDTTGGDDTTIEPLVFLDFLQSGNPFPTNGSDVIGQLSTAYFFRAQQA